MLKKGFCRQDVPDLLGPLDHDDPAPVEIFLVAHVLQIPGPRKPVNIQMNERNLPRVLVDQGEHGTHNGHVFRDTHPLRHALGEAGLPGAQLPDEATMSPLSRIAPMSRPSPESSPDYQKSSSKSNPLCRLFTFGPSRLEDDERHGVFGRVGDADMDLLDFLPSSFFRMLSENRNSGFPFGR